jgi:hypothetical protein
MWWMLFTWFSRAVAIAVIMLYKLDLSSATQESEDRLAKFYERLAQPDVKYCSDKTRLLPDCKICIPGLRQGTGSSSCNEYVKQSQEIRSEILKLTKERYGNSVQQNRPFGLYPCKHRRDIATGQDGLSLSNIFEHV